MKRWQKWLVHVLHLKGTLDTDRALREKNKRIVELEHEVEQLRGYTLIHVDPIMRRGYPQSAAYDNQGPITDKPAILHNTRGRYAQQRWPEFRKTHLMPTVKRPPPP